MFGRHIGVFFMKFIWKVYNLLSFIFMLETSGKTSKVPHKSPQKKAPKPIFSLSKDHPGEGVVNG